MQFGFSKQGLKGAVVNSRRRVSTLCCSACHDVGKRGRHCYMCCELCSRYHSGLLCLTNRRRFASQAGKCFEERHLMYRAQVFEMCLTGRYGPIVRVFIFWADSAWGAILLWGWRWHGGVGLAKAALCSIRDTTHIVMCKVEATFLQAIVAEIDKWNALHFLEFADEPPHKHQHFHA